MTLAKFLIRLGVGAVLFACLIREHEVHFEEIAGRLFQLPAWALLAALVLDLAGQSLSAFRWSRIAALAGPAIPFKDLWPIYFSGMFFNTCLPTSIGGDVIRVVGMARHTGSKTKTLASVFMDRNVGMAALLALGIVSAWLSGTSMQVTLSTYFKEPIVVDMWPLFLLLILVFVFSNLVLFSSHWYPRVERLVLRRLPASLHAKIEKLHAALQAYRRPCLEYGPTFLLSLAYQASEALLVWVLARGLGLDLSFWIFGSLVMFQAVAGLLPITVNNLGVRESIFCAVLMGQAYKLGLEPDQIKASALALSMAYLGVIVCSGLLGGLVYLVAGITKPSAEEARADDEIPASVPAMAEPVGGGR